MTAAGDTIRQLLKKYYKEYQKGDFDNGGCKNNSKRARKTL